MLCSRQRTSQNGVDQRDIGTKTTDKGTEPNTRRPAGWTLPQSEKESWPSVGASRAATAVRSCSRLGPIKHTYTPRVFARARRDARRRSGASLTRQQQPSESTPYLHIHNCLHNSAN